MKKSDIYYDLRQIILNEEISSQNDICKSLLASGHVASQSKVNRLLKKIGAIKIKNEKNIVVYKIPHESVLPLMTDSILSLIVNINSNETVIVIDTLPGGANVVARMLDYNKNNFEIMGTIAGDDSIVVLPISIKKIDEIRLNLENLLF
jgi:transcriptional regulator of arginine metabolism